MIPVTDPFGLAAPDGRTYFKVLGPPRALARTYEYLLIAVRNYRQAAQIAPDPRARAFNRGRAETIERAIGRMRAELTSVGRLGALMAEQEIQRNIRKTQVRPDPPKQGKRLVDVIVCRPIATTLPSGSIGIADMQSLDRLAYWRAQEFGYVIPDRRIIPGYFMPGFSAPDPAQVRVHPIFQQMPYARGMPALNLPAGTRLAANRSFLRDGVSTVAQWRLVKLSQIQKDAIVQLQRAAGVATAAFGPGGRRRGGPRLPPRRL